METRTAAANSGVVIRRNLSEGEDAEQMAGVPVVRQSLVVIHEPLLKLPVLAHLKQWTAWLLRHVSEIATQDRYPGYALASMHSVNSS